MGGVNYSVEWEWELIEPRLLKKEKTALIVIFCYTICYTDGWAWLILISFHRVFYKQAILYYKKNCIKKIFIQLSQCQ